MTRELLMKLINIEGVSGDECNVRAIIAKEMKKYVKNIEVDNFGNLIVTKKGKGPTILLAAHMDEVGLMVKRIDVEGRIYISAVGGLEPYSLLGEKVHLILKSGKLRGIITVAEMQNGELLEEIPLISDLYVDTGLSDQELVNLGVKPGTYLSFDTAGGTLGSKDIIFGKALDDRVGCYALIELARKLKGIKKNVIFLFTVQEEVGLFGAKAVQVSPDVGIVMETTNADDAKVDATKFVGEGPCITVKDAEMIGNRRLNELLEVVAQKYNIPFQWDVSEFGTTDGMNLSVTKGGIPTSVIGVPIRNIHSADSIASMKDIRNSIKLAEKFITTVKISSKKNNEGFNIC